MIKKRSNKTNKVSKVSRYYLISRGISKSMKLLINQSRKMLVINKVRECTSLTIESERLQSIYQRIETQDIYTRRAATKSKQN